MTTINIRLNLPASGPDKGSVITVYYKNRTNIVGTCTIAQNDGGTIATLTAAEELHNDLYVLYLYASVNGEIVLDGILLDDAPQNKAIDTIGSSTHA